MHHLFVYWITFFYCFEAFIILIQCFAYTTNAFFRCFTYTVIYSAIINPVHRYMDFDSNGYAIILLNITSTHVLLTHVPSIISWNMLEWLFDSCFVPSHLCVILYSYPLVRCFICHVLCFCSVFLCLWTIICGESDWLASHGPRIWRPKPVILVSFQEYGDV